MDTRQPRAVHLDIGPAIAALRLRPGTSVKVETRDTRRLIICRAADSAGSAAPFNSEPLPEPPTDAKRRVCLEKFRLLSDETSVVRFIQTYGVLDLPKRFAVAVAGYPDPALDVVRADRITRPEDAMFREVWHVEDLQNYLRFARFLHALLRLTAVRAGHTSLSAAERRHAWVAVCTFGGSMLDIEQFSEEAIQAWLPRQVYVGEHTTLAEGFVVEKGFLTPAAFFDWLTGPTPESARTRDAALRFYVGRVTRSANIRMVFTLGPSGAPTVTPEIPDALDILPFDQTERTWVSAWRDFQFAWVSRREGFTQSRVDQLPAWQAELSPVDFEQARWDAYRPYSSFAEDMPPSPLYLLLAFQFLAAVDDALKAKVCKHCGVNTVSGRLRVCQTCKNEQHAACQKRYERSKKAVQQE